MCTQVVRLFMALFLCGCGLFALPAKASTMPSPDPAMAHAAWADAADTLSDDAVLDEQSKPATGEAQADPSGPPCAGLTMLETPLLMARPPVPAGTTLRSRHPDGLQRPPCRDGITA
ncbi:MAG TPA: hypothetical protein VFL86_04500 [Burkholderiaceae bacterium]|nr:hypothetical protein [Burkholderiaceae bacterium]